MQNLEEQIATLMAQGRKIEAIAALREATGMGLADAKAAVEQVVEGQGLPTASKPSAATTAALPDDVRELAANGKTMEAIKLLRSRTSLGLKQAKDLVDTVPLEPGVKRSGCAGLILLGLATLSFLLVR